MNFADRFTELRSKLEKLEFDVLNALDTGQAKEELLRKSGISKLTPEELQVLGLEPRPPEETAELNEKMKDIELPEPMAVEIGQMSIQLLNRADGNHPMDWTKIPDKEGDLALLATKTFDGKEYHVCEIIKEDTADERKKFEQTAIIGFIKAEKDYREDKKRIWEDSPCKKRNMKPWIVV
jgi:hypothetical protein